MKTKKIFLLSVFLVCMLMIAPCASFATQEEVYYGVGIVSNAGDSIVFISAERTDGPPVIIELEPFSFALLPENTIRVSAAPGELKEGTIRMEVIVTGWPEKGGGTKQYKTIKETGQKIKIPATWGITEAMGKQLEADFGEYVVIPKEAYVLKKPPEQPPAAEKTEEASAAEVLQKEIDRHGDPFLRELNENYRKYRERLEEIDPHGEEAQAIREALPKIEAMIKERIEREKKTYGDDWLERYRDPASGELPGGFLSYDRVLDKAVRPRQEGEIRGIVYSQKGYEVERAVQRIFTVGNIMVMGDYSEERVVSGRPLGDFNVLWYALYCELPDKQLFDTFKRLLKTRTDIGRRIQEGNRKITKQEFMDCQELMKMKNKVLSSARWKAGSLPGWRTKTDENGKFSFTIEQFPGRDNVMYLILHVAAFPPTGHTTHFMFDNQSPGGIGTAEFPLYGENPRVIPESAIPQNLMRAYPDESKLGQLLSERKKELRNAEKEREAVRKKWEKRPPHIEASWEERALKDQRALRDRYVKDNGPSKDWNQDLRKQFELELAAVPAQSRQEWEQDVDEWEKQRTEALEDAESTVRELEKNIAKAEIDVAELGKKKERWSTRLLDTIGDITIFVPEVTEPSPPGIFEFGDTIQGANISPEVKVGYDTNVYLVKQTIDDKIGNRPVSARYGATGQPGIMANLDNPDDPRPPFLFTLDQSLGKHLAINNFIHRYTNSRALGVYSVYTIFEGLTDPTMLPSRLQFLFLPLPRTVEVEGYPIRDSKKFHAKIDELLAEYNEIRRKYAREMNDLWLDRKAGKLSTQQANDKWQDVDKRWRADSQTVIKKIDGITKSNPAFR